MSYFRVCLPQIRIIAEKSQGQTSLKSKVIHEPLAEEEWMSLQIEERIADEKRLEVLRSRLEVSEQVDNCNVTLPLRFSSALNLATF